MNHKPLHIAKTFYQHHCEREITMQLIQNNSIINLVADNEQLKTFLEDIRKVDYLDAKSRGRPDTSAYPRMVSDSNMMVMTNVEYQVLGHDVEFGRLERLAREAKEKEEREKQKGPAAPGPNIKGMGVKHVEPILSKDGSEPVKDESWVLAKINITSMNPRHYGNGIGFSPINAAWDIANYILRNVEYLNPVLVETPVNDLQLRHTYSFIVPCVYLDLVGLMVQMDEYDEVFDALELIKKYGFRVTPR